MDPQKLEQVQQIINQSEKELKSIEVSKDLELDIGNLASFDKNEVANQEFENAHDHEKYIEESTRDGVQKLLNSVWDLKQITLDNVVYCELPPPTFRLPREKAVPKAKPLTKWEQFAKTKGIVKKKKDKNVWDDTLKEWVPRYGLKKKLAEKRKNWVVEVPDSADPHQNLITKLSTDKKERKARNEFQRLRNIAKSKKINIPNVGIINNNTQNKDELSKAISTARISTASMGKFQPTLPKEKKSILKQTTKHVKAGAPMKFADEKDSALKILDRITKPELNLTRAVVKQVKFDNIEESRKPRKGETTRRRSKMGGKSRGASEIKAKTKGYLKEQGTKRKKKLPSNLKPSKIDGVITTKFSKKGRNSSLNKVLGVKGGAKPRKRKSGFQGKPGGGKNKRK